MTMPTSTMKLKRWRSNTTIRLYLFCEWKNVWFRHEQIKKIQKRRQWNNKQKKQMNGEKAVKLENTHKESECAFRWCDCACVIGWRLKSTTQKRRNKAPERRKIIWSEYRCVCMKWELRGRISIISRRFEWLANSFVQQSTARQKTKFHSHSIETIARISIAAVSKVRSQFSCTNSGHAHTMEYAGQARPKKIHIESKLTKLIRCVDRPTRTTNFRNFNARSGNRGRWGLFYFPILLAAAVAWCVWFMMRYKKNVCYILCGSSRANNSNNNNELTWNSLTHYILICIDR